MATDSTCRAFSHSARRSNSGVVAPKLAISRPLPSCVAAHTQCRSLPRSTPATLRRMTGKPSSRLLLLSPFSRSFLSGIAPHPSEHARPGWLLVDSALGESYESLANVQLPSWNHAHQAAYARMKLGS